MFLDRFLTGTFADVFVYALFGVLVLAAVFVLVGLARSLWQD